MNNSKQSRTRSAREHLNNVKCSYMNDTRWHAVLSTLALHQVPARIKLLWDEYSNVANPGAEVITGYDSYGKPNALGPQIAFNVTGRYWECTAIGPFLPSDIEWLAVQTEKFTELSMSLPANLQIVLAGEESVIIGYEFMPS